MPFHREKSLYILSPSGINLTKSRYCIWYLSCYKTSGEINVRILAGVLGVLFIMVALWDAFETVVLPRRVTRKVRVARLFYRLTWRVWSALAHSVSSGRRLENYLSFYGPLSLILLLAIWAGILVVGFAILYWLPGNAVKTPEGNVDFITCIYYSGTAFFTLGPGDVTPSTLVARALVVLEAGIGFGFLAIVISYLPALNQSFSKRETNISLLDSRAGSPPTALEIIRRNMWNGGDALRQLLFEWERWSSEFLESHLSFPVLAYFRSQHDNQSWLGALTSILDTSALAIVGFEGACQNQARLTFAMARHAIVDMALILQCPPCEPAEDRFPTGTPSLQSTLGKEGVELHLTSDTDEKLKELRKMYEPYVYALSEYLCLSLPPLIPESNQLDNWQISEWGPSAGLNKISRPGGSRNTHF